MVAVRRRAVNTGLWYLSAIRSDTFDMHDNHTNGAWHREEGGAVRRAWRRWLVLLILLLAAPAGAETYTAEVLVTARDAAAEQAGLRQALAQTLTALTGDARLAQGPVGKALGERLEEFLSEYRYEPADGDRWRLVAVFDQGALLAALREQGVAVRPRLQETLLVWLAVQARPDGPARLLGEDTPGPLRDTVAAALRAAGYQPLWPVLDLDDLRQVRVADLRQGFLRPVAAASARYGVAASVAGTLEALPDGRWRARLSRVAETPAAVVREAGSPGEALRQALAALPRAAAAADDGAGDADAAVDGGTLRIQVAYVKSWQDFQRLSRYLDGQEAVQAWRLLSHRGDVATLEVTLLGDPAHWLAALRRDGVLEQVAPPVGAAADGLTHFLLR